MMSQAIVLPRSGTRFKIHHSSCGLSQEGQRERERETSVEDKESRRALGASQMRAEPRVGFTLQSGNIHCAFCVLGPALGALLARSWPWPRSS